MNGKLQVKKRENLYQDRSEMGAMGIVLGELCVCTSVCVCAWYGCFTKSPPKYQM